MNVRSMLEPTICRGLSSGFCILSPRIWVGVVGMALLMTVLAAPATTYVVNTNNDYGANSLRQSIVDANNSNGADSIEFSITGDIILTSPLPVIADELVIQGPMGATVTIRGNDMFRVFNIAAGVPVQGRDLVLADGAATGFDDAAQGGGIRNAGTVTLQRVTIRDSFAEFGGGIYNATGAQITLVKTTLDDNSASTSGAGIYNAPGATTVVAYSTIREGNSSSYGGAIAADQQSQSALPIGFVLVMNSLLSDNEAEWGGGIYNEGQQIDIRNSTLEQNMAYYSGGGIDTLRATGSVRLFNSTLSENSIYYNTENAAAIHNNPIYPSNVWIEFSALVDNQAPGDQGGVRGPFTSKNSIFDNSGSNCLSSDGPITALGNNLSSDDSCPGFTIASSDAIGLGPLADHGGGTKTHAPLPGSLAIDAVTDCTRIDGSTVVALDQRGVARPVDGDQDGLALCDIGAHEANDMIFADGFD